jgi:hypothetical protein
MNNGRGKLIPSQSAGSAIKRQHPPVGRTTAALPPPTNSEGISRDLIKAMAMDAGKSLCAYLEVMFPEVWHGQNSGFKISMKHHVYNDIMALAELHDAERNQETARSQRGTPQGMGRRLPEDAEEEVQSRHPRTRVRPLR